MIKCFEAVSIETDDHVISDFWIVAAYNLLRVHNEIFSTASPHLASLSLFHQGRITIIN